MSIGDTLRDLRELRRMKLTAQLAPVELAELLDLVDGMADRLKQYEGDRDVVLTPGNCRSCAAPIVWVTMSTTGAMNPLDPRMLNVVTDDGRVVRGRESHFGSCPHRDKHRKK